MVDHPAHFDAQGRVSERRLGATRGRGGQRRQRAFGRHEQLLPFPAPFVRQ